MNALCYTALILLLPCGTPNFKDRERHPLAPSLPRLTKEEESRAEAIIDRMILADVGKLKGMEAKKALEEFSRLGSETTFLLIDGLNRAADMESSCPAIIIAKKLASIFLTTNDIELLTYAKENIGAGVTAKRHVNALKDLQFQCQLRKAALQRRALAQGSSRPVASMSLAELEKAAVRERGLPLRQVLTEAEKRQGAKAIDILLIGIKSPDAQAVKLSQGLLAKNLQHQSEETLKGLLVHERRELRLAAAAAIGSKKLRLGSEVIDLLQDGDPEVRQAARRALVQLSGGADYGPAADASFGDRETAVRRWRDWWSGQK